MRIIRVVRPTRATIITVITRARREVIRITREVKVKERARIVTLVRRAATNPKKEEAHTNKADINRKEVGISRKDQGPTTTNRRLLRDKATEVMDKTIAPSARGSGNTDS